MELSIYKREKKQINKLRHQKNVPAVVYEKGRQNENIYIQLDELTKKLAGLKPGELSTTIFNLKGEKESYKALVKDIQYNVIDYKVLHLDFLRLDDKKEVKANVAIRCIGINECKGLKLGGTFRQLIRCMKVQCLPKDLPKEFVVDIKDMEVGDMKRLTDIELPKGVTSVSKKLNEVVVAISKH